MRPAAAGRANDLSRGCSAEDIVVGGNFEGEVRAGALGMAAGVRAAIRNEDSFTLGEAIGVWVDEINTESFDIGLQFITREAKAD